MPYNSTEEMRGALKTSVFSENARTIMCKRYYLRGPRFMQAQHNCMDCNEYHENEEEFFDRVSMGDPVYREMLGNLWFLPNSPTLMNLGNPDFEGTLSACFKFDVADNMFDTADGIMNVAMKASKVLKAGGGVGYALHVRPEGALVNSTHGKALGPLGVLRIFHTLAREITQGGKRDAAQMAILHCEDPDVEKFIHAKDEDPDALGTFNISVALTDQFMERALARATDKGGAWLYESGLLRAMAESAWKTGDPGCYFIDTAEKGNPTPWAGKLTGTNPCGEVPLLDNEPCNLGSINLGKMVKSDGNIDWDLLHRTVRLATRYLDDVLDRNVFPDPLIDNAARYTRKLGLGVCGFQDLLVLLKIPYDSEPAVALGRNLMQVINVVAENASIELAEEKGVAPCFESQRQARVDHEDPKLPRNATRTCIAPTGTIAILMDASSGIEPYFALRNTRTMGDGTVLVETPWPLEKQLREASIPSMVEIKVADEIGYEWHIKHQAAFQAHTDLAVSKTINMPNSATPEDIYDAYVMMWKLGCKGGTIYRDGSRDNQVLKHIEEPSTKAWDDVYFSVAELNGRTIKAGDELSVMNGQVRVNGWRDAPPMERPGIIHKFEVGGMEGYAIVGLYEDGQPMELFIDVARQGSTLDGVVDWLAQGFSVALQLAHKHGVPFTVFTDKWLGRKFEPSGFTTNPDIPQADSIADYLGRWLTKRFAGTAPVQATPSKVGEIRGDTCPDCGRMLIHSEGCAHCVCGYERC